MLSFQDALELHEMSIIDFGGSHGIRDIDMLKSAVVRPSTTFDSIELYTSPIQKAAAIFESIIKNHPFVDGNKRTAWLACFTMLRLYGYKLYVSQEDAYNFVIEVASSQMDFDKITGWIEQYSTKILPNHE